MGLVADMFERFMSRQSVFFDNLSEETKEKMDGLGNKFAVLRVTGPEGGTFYFQYKHEQLILLEKPPDTPYEDLDKLYLDGDLVNYPSGDEVLFDIIDGSLSPRAARSRNYFRVNTDRIIYDTEEFAQAFERFLEQIQIVLRDAKK